MYQYPKSIQTNEQLLKKWSDAGMIIEPDDNAIEVLDTIGYYRLKGYPFHFYNKVAGRYQEGTSFSDIVKLYHFDFRLSHLVFSFLSQIEVSLRARFVNALLLHNDPLILNDPSIFRDKEDYWKNQSNIASEIARSKDMLTSWVQSVSVLRNICAHNSRIYNRFVR